MKKQELIKKLKGFVANDLAKWKGQDVFAGFFAEYLMKLDIPYDTKYDHWRIDDYIPELAVEVFEELRLSQDELAVRYRRLWGEEVPNITDFGESDILSQGAAVQTTLKFLLKDIFQEGWIEQKIESYCKAQFHVVQQTFDKFARRVYRKGLYEIIDDCKSRGMSGKFGETELRSFIIAGRVMFTFARKNGEENELSVSFIGEDGDKFLWSAGLQSVHADFKTSLDMIEDVIKNWPTDNGKQKEIFTGNKSVTLDVIAAMKSSE